jgi:hypothetical protein
MANYIVETYAGTYYRADVDNWGCITITRVVDGDEFGFLQGDDATHLEDQLKQVPVWGNGNFEFSDLVDILLGQYDL